MIPALGVAFARGHAGARLVLDRTPNGAPRASRAITLLAALLTLPFVVALIVNGVGQSTHWFSPPGVLPWLLGGAPALAQRLALGPPLALLLLTIARVRVRASRTDDRRVLGVSARPEGREI